MGHTLATDSAREAEQEQRADEERGEAEHDDHAPVVNVGRVPREQREAEERQELRQSDQAEVEHTAGEVIYLPADGDHHHLRRDGREEPRKKKEGEIAFPENRESAGRGSSRQTRAARRELTDRERSRKRDRPDAGRAASGTCGPTRLGPSR